MRHHAECMLRMHTAARHITFLWESPFFFVDTLPAVPTGCASWAGTAYFNRACVMRKCNRSSGTTISPSLGHTDDLRVPWWNPLCEFEESQSGFHRASGIFGRCVGSTVCMPVVIPQLCALPDQALLRRTLWSAEGVSNSAMVASHKCSFNAIFETGVIGLLGRSCSLCQHSQA